MSKKAYNKISLDDENAGLHEDDGDNDFLDEPPKKENGEDDDEGEQPKQPENENGGTAPAPTSELSEYPPERKDEEDPKESQGEVPVELKDTATKIKEEIEDFTSQIKDKVKSIFKKGDKEATSESEESKDSNRAEKHYNLEQYNMDDGLEADESEPAPNASKRPYELGRAGDNSSDSSRKSPDLKSKGLHDENPLFVKGELISYTPEIYFKASKEIKKHNVFNFFLNSTTRYLHVDDGYLYTLDKVKSNACKVKGIRRLIDLFKIYIDSENNKNIRLVFLNKQDKRLPPEHKAYTLDKPDEFMIRLKKELHRLGSDITVNK